jgi:uncharacterized tellurite resistance protein B-like protein
VSAELTPEGARRIYRVMSNVAACDGSVAASERDVLDAARARFGISPEDAQALEAEGAAGEGMEIGEEKSERDTLISCMIEVVMADGRVDGAERKRLVSVAKQIGLTFQELQDQLLPHLT